MRAAPRISDTSFEGAARQACSQSVRIFDTATTLSKQPTNSQSADLLENIDQTFTALVAQLRAIPVTASDQAAVNGWLADWDAFIAFGHTYAAAVRTGAEGPLVKADTASQDQLLRRRNAFATANHMPSCVFH